MPTTKKTPEATDMDTQENLISGPTVADYMLVTADQFIYVDPSLNVVLYPGVSAVMPGDQYRSLPEWTQSLLTSKAITESEFNTLFKKSGVMGIIR